MSVSSVENVHAMEKTIIICGNRNDELATYFKKSFPGFYSKWLLMCVMKGR
jgi:hypothetical protein